MKTGQATSSEQLEKEIMDSCIPKNEREWWAKRKIESLITKIEQSKKENQEIRYYHMEKLKYKNIKLQRVVECVETAIARAQRFDNHIGISLEDFNDLQQALADLEEK